MNKRPKSREETPKEGSDSARRYRTATIWTALHKTQEFSKPFQRNLRQAGGYATGRLNSIFFNKIKLLREQTRESPCDGAATIHKSRLREWRRHRKCMAKTNLIRKPEMA
jgi:hypothetical protein